MQATLFLTIHKIMISFPGLLLCIFCGSWSDKVGRKIPIIISCFFSIVGVASFIFSSLIPLPNNTNFTLNDHLIDISLLKTSKNHISNITADQLNTLKLREDWNSSNLTFLLLFLLGSLLRGISGKSSLVTMAVHSYVSDISEKDTRTERLGRLLSMNFFGLFVGSFLVGLLVEKCSFYTIFTIVIFLYILSIFLAYFFMMNVSSENDSLEETPNENKVDCKEDTIDETQYISDDKEVLQASDEEIQQDYINKYFFSKFSVIKDFFSILIEFKNKKVLFYFIVIVVQQTCKSGEIDVTLLYTAKSPLNWTKSLYGYFLALDYACLGISTAVLLPSIIFFFKVEDISLAIVGMAFKVIILSIIFFLFFSNSKYNNLIFTDNKTFNFGNKSIN